MQTISTYIICFNEAEKIKAAVESVLWADEIVVVTTPNIAAVSAPRMRPRHRACDSVCLRPIEIRSAAPIANTAMTAQCDGPYAVNCRCAENSSINYTVSSNIIATGGYRIDLGVGRLG